MEHLEITRTKFSLQIHCNAETGLCEMEGSSYPENAFEFFKPVQQWMTRYFTEVGSRILLDLKLEYLNTSSSKCILDLFKTLEDYVRQGGEVQVNWYYEQDDEDMMETGEEFLEDLELPFSLKVLESA